MNTRNRLEISPRAVERACVLYWRRRPARWPAPILHPSTRERQEVGQ